MEESNFLAQSNHKVFIIKRSELAGRLDAKTYEPERRLFAKTIKSNDVFLKLKDVIKEGAYGILPPGDGYNENNPITFVRATDLKENLEIDFENTLKVKQEFLVKRASIQRGDILIAVKGATIASPKCIAFVKDDIENCIVNGSIFRFRVLDGVSPKYIAHMLNSDLVKRQMKDNLVANNAVDYLDKPLIYNLRVPVPDYEIQINILEDFEEAYKFKLLKENQARLQLASIDKFLLEQLGIVLPQYKNDIADRIFTVKIGNLKNRIDPLYYNSQLKVFNTGIYPSVQIRTVIKSMSSGYGIGREQQANEDKGIIQIRPTNISEYGLLKFDKNVYVPHVLASKFDLLEKNDVLFNNTNSQELVGKTAILREDRELTYSNHITVLRMDSSIINPVYLWAILNLFQKNRIFYSLCTNWNNQSGIGMEVLKTLEIPLPPMPVQEKIADAIDGFYLKSYLLNNEAEYKLNEVKDSIERKFLNKL